MANGTVTFVQSKESVNERYPEEIAQDFEVTSEPERKSGSTCCQ
jgi:hypothetical protein